MNAIHIHVLVSAVISMSYPITIQTRRGRDISVAIFPDEPPNKIPAYHARFSREYPENILRRQPTASYNCFGLVFACRRACVMDDSVNVILRDDGYRPLGRGELPVAGDIVIYYEDGRPEHVGVVIELRELGNLKIPIVISKWGPGPEYIHNVMRTPYGLDYKYWTERA